MKVKYITFWFKITKDTKRMDLIRFLYINNKCNCREIDNNLYSRFAKTIYIKASDFLKDPLKFKNGFYKILIL